MLEKKLSMEEKKFRTLQDEFREVNKKYQINKSELVEQTELNIKLDGKVKLLQEDVDRQVEEATGRIFCHVTCCYLVTITPGALER